MANQISHAGHAQRNLGFLALICSLSLQVTSPFIYSQEPYLVRDLYQNPSNVGSAPNGGVEMGGFVYFAATTLEHGEELWRSDGTPGGVTELVKDIRPGVEGSEIEALTVIGSTLFFRANDGLHGTELWKSDGTEAGTALIEINPGTLGSSPWDLAVLNGDLFFNANDGVHGNELWMYDSSEAEARLVKDINPSGGSIARDLNFGNRYIEVMNGKLYLAATDGTHGAELWTSDGTEGGTLLVKDIFPGSAGSMSFSISGELVAAGNRLYFPATNGVSGTELWCSDGTEAGTIACRDINVGSGSSSPEYMTPLGNKVVFKASGSGSNYELWISDGTEMGTFLLKEINPGPNGSYPTQGVAVGNHVFFSATDPVHGRELWRTDGTEAGTIMVMDINPGTSPTGFANMIALDSNTLIFSASAPGIGRELWISRIAENSTALVKDIDEGSGGGLSTSRGTFFKKGGEIFFAANDGSKSGSGSFGELWKTDGTEAGTVLVHAINTSPQSSNPIMFTPLGNRVVFTYEGFSSRLLIRTDGTEVGTEFVKDLGAGRILAMIPVGNSIFICFANTQSSAMKYEIWKTNGTEAGTVRVSSDVGVYTHSSDHPRPGNFTVAGNTLYFTTTQPDTGRELWMSNGTTAGTKMVKDIRPGTDDLNSSNPGALTAIGNTLFFHANDGTHGFELWKTNGTAAGTIMVKDIFGGSASSAPDSLVAMGDTLFFSATEGVTVYGYYREDRELWKSDGTEAGTVRIKDIHPDPTFLPIGNISSYPNRLTVVGNTLLFCANDGVHGNEFWKSDGTEAGTVMIKDLVTGSTGIAPDYLTSIGNTLYFVLDDGIHGRELWKSDGTDAGTVLFADTRPGSTLGLGPQDLKAVGPWLFFRADNGVHGDELWRSDGTPAGTVSFDINPGPTGSSPMHFGFMPTRLFFSATTSSTGREPFAIPISIPVPDTRLPTQRITSKGGRVKEPAYDLTGTASDNVQVASVHVSLNGGAPVPAVLGDPDSKGAVPFSLSGLQLENGVNEISVTTFDLSGNVSNTTTLTVNFLSNRPAIAGSYQCLLLSDDAASPANDNTGVFTAKVTLAGAFTGKVGIGKYSLPVRGIIDNAGHARFRVKGIKAKATALFPSTFVLTKKVNRNLTLVYGQFAFEVDGGLIEGSLRNVDTSASVSVLAGARAHYNGKTVKVPDPYLLNGGRYTAHLPAHLSQPGLTGSDYPQGVGVATASIKKNGRIMTRGTLADGTKFTSSATLSETLAWPLFARLYKKGGALAGWVQADDSQHDTDFLGTDLVWLRPPNLSAKHYPAGWTSGVSLSILGGKYQRPGNASVLTGLGPDDLEGDGNASLQLSDGLLAAPINHSLNIDIRNRITNVPANRDFQVKISASSGLLSGSFTHSDGSKTLWRGVIHQKGAPAGGIGFFLSTVPRNAPDPGQGGRVELAPKD